MSAKDSQQPGTDALRVDPLRDRGGDVMKSLPLSPNLDLPCRLPHRRVLTARRRRRHSRANALPGPRSGPRLESAAKGIFMDLILMLAAMLPMPLIIIGAYLYILKRRQHSSRHRRRKIRL